MTKYFIIPSAFHADAVATGYAVSPKIGPHSNGNKFFVDQNDPSFPRLLEICVRRNAAGCRRAREAMHWFCVQITEQDRQKMLKSLNLQDEDKVIAMNPSFSQIY